MQATRYILLGVSILGWSEVLQVESVGLGVGSNLFGGNIQVGIGDYGDGRSMSNVETPQCDILKNAAIFNAAENERWQLCVENGGVKVSPPESQMTEGSLQLPMTKYPLAYQNSISYMIEKEGIKKLISKLLYTNQTICARVYIVIEVKGNKANPNYADFEQSMIRSQGLAQCVETNSLSTFQFYNDHATNEKYTYVAPISPDNCHTVILSTMEGKDYISENQAALFKSISKSTSARNSEPDIEDLLAKGQQILGIIYNRIKGNN